MSALTTNQNQPRPTIAGKLEGASVPGVQSMLWETHRPGTKVGNTFQIQAKQISLSEKTPLIRVRGGIGRLLFK